MSGFDLEWNEAGVTAEVVGECREAVREGAEVVADDARGLCPEGTGELKQTIEVKEFERPDAIGAYVKAGGDKLGHIARFVELGTPGTTYKSGSKKGESRQPIKAQPYMRPALKKNKPEILAKFKNRMKK